MTRIKLQFATIVFLIVAFSSTAIGQPQLEFSEDYFDFGKVCQFAKVSHTFWIKSTGTDTLRIEKIVPGCGCTQAPLTDSVLAPGDSTDLEIIFSTKSYRGYVSKRPYLETNAGEQKYYVKFQSELIPKPDEMLPITMTPYRLDVSQFSSKTRRNGKFKIANQTDQTYTIKLIDHGRNFDVKLPAQIGPNEIVEGSVRVHEDAVETDFEQSLTFELNDESNSRFTLPVKRKYRPTKNK